MYLCQKRLDLVLAKDLIGEKAAAMARKQRTTTAVNIVSVNYY